VGLSADALRVPMPLLSVLQDHLLRTIAQQGDDVDWSAIGHTIARMQGSSSVGRFLPQVNGFVLKPSACRPGMVCRS